LSSLKTSITIDPSVKHVRGFVVCAILRNVKFDQESMQSFLALQEKLHETFCRERKYASIGTHDLDTLIPPFTYKAVDPKDIHFIPLFQKE
jgi:phenylalanyl-tRNA synthetase beta chain